MRDRRSDRSVGSRTDALARGLLLSAALLVGAGSALAADLPSARVSPIFAPPEAVPFTWTGFYVGVNVGYGTDHFAFPYDIDHLPLHGFLGARGGTDAQGVVGGGQIGFNYQFPSVKVLVLPVTVVAGVEVDNDASGIRGSSTIYGRLPGGTNGSATFGTKLEDFGTARFRVGPSFGRFWPYFTAGFTYGTINTNYSVSAPFSISGSTTTTRSGVFPHVGVVGIGLEYAFTNHLSAKVEYLYDFINARYYSFENAGTHVGFQSRTMYHIGRVGLNYKFDAFPGTAPVVARY